MSDSLSAAAADTARLRELAEAVGTFGPWQRFGDLIAQPEVDIVYWAYRDLPPAEWDDAETRYAPLLDFIAACSPDVILALLAEVEVLRAARDDDAMKISLDHSETSVVEERLIAARRAARALLDVAEKHHPGNDWWSVGIARRHLEALLAATWLRSASLQDAAPDSDLGMRAVGRGDAGAAVLLRRAEVAEAALTEARAAFAQAREEIDETAEERDDWARAHANAQRTLATTENERNSVRAALEQAQAALREIADGDYGYPASVLARAALSGSGQGGMEDAEAQEALREGERDEREGRLTAYEDARRELGLSGGES